MPKNIVLSTLIVFTIISSIYSESVAPAITPPGGLDSTAIPMFISFGFDDNKYADGVDWASTELLKDRLNHSGAGNKATYDGTPMEVDFFVIGNSDYEYVDPPIDYFSMPVPAERPATESWKKAYESGSGINGHTFTHSYEMPTLQYDEIFAGIYPSILMELGNCTKYLINVAGFPHSQIFGFRTPYLNHSVNGDSFKATAFLGMLYDCTIDNGIQGSNTTNANPMFPGTMEGGWPPFKTHLKTPDLWQVPNGVYSTSGGSFDVLGFDSGKTNGWPSGISGSGFFNQMKTAIEFHYKGSRAPIDLGLHSDYYSFVADTTSVGSAAHNFSQTLEERRSALIMLLDWIESDLPDARVVRKIDIIRWMRNPVALSDLSRNDELTFKTDNPSGGLSGGISIKEGSSTALINGTGGVDVTIVDPQDWQLSSYAGLRYDLIDNLDGAHSMKITYTSSLPLEIRLNQSDLNGEDYQFGLISTDGNTNTVEINLNSDDFMQPRPRTTEAPLDLSKVTAISVAGTAFDTTLSGSFNAEIEVYGKGQITADVAIKESKQNKLSNTLLIKNITNNNILISTKMSGKYAIDLFSINGKKVTALTSNLKVGNNVIPLSNISKGYYYIKVSNKHYSTQKSIIIK